MSASAMIEIDGNRIDRKCLAKVWARYGPADLDMFCSVARGEADPERDVALVATATMSTDPDAPQRAL